MRLVISGGVHGNELLGIYLVRSLKEEGLSFPNLSIDYLLANPKAIDLCRRYVDRDLNRSFDREMLEVDTPIYEYERAKVIAERLAGIDFLIDLHTTTANMGVTLVVSSGDRLSLNMAAELVGWDSSIKVLRWLGSQEGAFINSLVPHSLTIEVGPVPQGVLHADLFFKTRRVVLKALQLLDRGEVEGRRGISCYNITQKIDFPRKEGGELAGMVHPELQGRDYGILRPGDPLFIDFRGEVVEYGGEPAFPVFINEAAYYEKGIALFLTERVPLGENL
ncbi:MAG: aspartoacylase [Epsilonproteobacteria bacterium]|nr:aspartoacylase [Campylobacterota bacterium]NPA56119.1 aspartoacylase [Campylobacterota bacterium]